MIMRKKLITDLKNLAQKILLLKEEEEFESLHQNAQDLYEKLSVLSYLSKSIGTSGDSMEEKINLTVSEINKKESDTTLDLQEEIQKVPESEEETQILDNKEAAISIEEKIVEDIPEIEQPTEDLEDLFVPTFDSIKDDFSQKKEFKDTISLDDTENLFSTKKSESNQLSLNDKLVNNNIQVGLNDRIAFVNSLFNFSQSDFNKTLSTLNTFEGEIEAKQYIESVLKKRYNWIGKEEIEQRFILLIERKFL